ncbi:MAG: DNA double-strand break repair nuclease NurA [Spirochaetota bacterium]
MNSKEIPQSAIEAVARHINNRSNKNYGINPIGHEDNIETPQVFEIIPFDEIDKSNRHFFAIDGSYNSEQFYNGLSIAIYTAGYICFHHGQQLKMNNLDDPMMFGQAYYPNNILITNEEHMLAIYDEFLDLKPIQRLLEFFGEKPEEIFPYKREQVCVNLSTLLSFCQEVLEIAIILEIAELSITQKGDFILRDGTLRPLQIKQSFLVKLGKYIKEKGIILIAVTKQSPIKMELSYTLKQIDIYLQDQLKPKYPFSQIDPRRKKLCCWFEIPTPVLQASYQGDMFIKKAIRGGRGFGLFFAARLDYVEKLQNYDWVIIDVNIFDAIPGINSGEMLRDRASLAIIFKEITRLTQEHYILGYPYPLAEVHNFISLKRSSRKK